MSCLTHLVGNKLSFEIVLCSFFQSEDLRITESMINESGVPPAAVAFFAVADVVISSIGRAQVLAVEASVIIEFLGKNHTDGIATLAREFYSQPSGNILSEVYDIRAVSLLDATSLERLKHLHAFSDLSTKHSLRNIGTFGFHPFGIIKAYLAPTHHLHTGIVFLTVVFVVGANGSLSRYLPAFVI